MLFKNWEEIRYCQFQIFDGCALKHGIFTRHGGVSPDPWSSLNLGGTVGDSQENIIENRRRCFSAMGRSVESLIDVWQIHSTDVVFAETPRPTNSPHQKADILITDKAQLTMMMRFADCVPLFFYDPIQRVVGLAHAGWQGTVNQVAKVTVEAMKDHYGVKPQNILAGIGPSIGVEKYPVGEEVVQQVQTAFGNDAAEMVEYRDGNPHFNLWEANRICLLNAGVSHIEIAGICTASHRDDWFSHRGDHGKTGRFGAILAIEE